MSDSKSTTYQTAGSVARASTSQIRMRDPCASFAMIPGRPSESTLGASPSGGPLLDVLYITKGVFCEDFRLDPALAGTNTEANQQATAELAEGASNQAVGPDPPGNALPHLDRVDPALIRPAACPVLHQVVLVAPGEDPEERSRGQPPRPGQADLEVDEARFATLVDDDVLTLVQVNIHGPTLVHFLEQAIQVREERVGNRLAVTQGMASDVVAGDGMAEDRSSAAHRARQSRNPLQASQLLQQRSLILRRPAAQPTER